MGTRPRVCSSRRIESRRSDFTRTRIAHRGSRPPIPTDARPKLVVESSSSMLTGTVRLSGQPEAQRHDNATPTRAVRYAPPPHLRRQRSAINIDPRPLYTRATEQIAALVATVTDAPVPPRAPSSTYGALLSHIAGGTRRIAVVGAGGDGMADATLPRRRRGRPLERGVRERGQDGGAGRPGRTTRAWTPSSRCRGARPPVVSPCRAM